MSELQKQDADNAITKTFIWRDIRVQFGQHGSSRKAFRGLKFKDIIPAQAGIHRRTRIWAVMMERGK